MLLALVPSAHSAKTVIRPFSDKHVSAAVITCNYANEHEVKRKGLSFSGKGRNKAFISVSACGGEMNKQVVKDRAYGLVGVGLVGGVD